MDRLQVSEIAMRHRARSGRPDAIRGADSVIEEQIRGQVDALWMQLGAECVAFCDAYNAAYGADRVYCQPHDDAIVVRSADEPQETVTFTRFPHGSIDRSHLAAHRYSLSAAPVDIPLETHVANRTVFLRLDGRIVNASDLVLAILERFTGELSTQVASTLPPD